MTSELKVTESPIPGLFVVRLPVHGDSRGWFKENWQNEKSVALGFPDFAPIQNNVSFNEEVGTTRGIHAEPWDKYVSVATGKVFGAWVDLREGDTFGAVFTIEIDPSVAVFVPRGVGNAYQTLEPNTSYTYLVNAHWSATAKYTYLSLWDDSAAIQWPIPLAKAEVSEKDKNQPTLGEVVPLKAKRTLILGANGQIGKALAAKFPEAIALNRAQFDLADQDGWSNIDWSDVGVVVNAAAYTNVDEAETIEGRKLAWAVNAEGVRKLAKRCDEFGITLVHFSTDYVLDGSGTTSYSELAPLSPINSYGQSKAAGDLAVLNLKKHYLIRTSWVIGEGKNFVHSIVAKLENSNEVNVVVDQIGQPTFGEDIANAVAYILENRIPFGTYNVASQGEPTSWFEFAQAVAERLGKAELVMPTTSEEYESATLASGRSSVAPRPKYSVLSTAKLASLGFTCAPWQLSLAHYLEANGY